MPAPKKLTDRQLAALGRKFAKAKALAIVEAEYATELKGQILEQLALRKVDDIAVGGVRLVRRQRVTRVVNMVKLQTLVGRSLFTRITQPAIDTERWNAAVVGEMIPKDILRQVETETPTAPWVEVSEVS